MNMKHISLASNAKYANELIEVLEQDACWPGRIGGAHN
jgi:hypothetical protein